MVGLLMIIPLMPFYAREMGGGALIVAVLMGAFTAAQLLSAPLWGRFSDRYGRRPALLVGLTASCIAYVVFAYAGSIWLLLLSRVVQGAGGGTVGVIQAYVADSVEPDSRAKALGWLSAATNVGVAIGPAIGGAALKFGSSGPGLAAASLCLVNIFFAWKFLRESRDMTEAHGKKPRHIENDHSSRHHTPRRARAASDLDLRDSDGRVLGIDGDPRSLSRRQIRRRQGSDLDLLHLRRRDRSRDARGNSGKAGRSIRRGAAVARRSRPSRDGPGDASSRAAATSCWPSRWR